MICQQGWLESARSCFTLIELLVVVAITGILAALLLPALQNAKQTSKTAICVNNLRQIHFASMAYADDWDGWLIVCDYGIAAPHPPDFNWYWWQNKQLGGYIWPNKLYGDNLGRCPVTVCPSMSKADKTRSFGDQQYFDQAGSYNPNARLSCYANENRHGIARLGHARPDAPYWMDAHRQSNGWFSSPRWFGDPDCNDLVYPYFLRFSHGGGVRDLVAFDDYGGARGGRCNIVFVDGHVESLTQCQLPKLHWEPWD
ncbi:MAG: prepilin-type N-terminal cleavage/methylation domain-containing protein [Verrucomicrobia bacterium]|nr:prepilin-type N-terminal cleavage/methylation domain-containing protein [Verrucomicrobiota bacterium]